jgi:hypothetical protein
MFDQIFPNKASSSYTLLHSTAFLVSAFLFVVNLGWKKMCYFLTLLEAHYTWSRFKYVVQAHLNYLYYTSILT